jgi:hypothetical protein
MSAHTHREHVEGCYRCELSQDEARAAEHEWLEARERAAVALYKFEHPFYAYDDFAMVPLLETVTTYRERADVAIRAFEGQVQTDRRAT